MRKYDFSQVENMVNEYTSNGSRTRLGHNIVCVVSLKQSRVYAAGKHIIGHVAKATWVSNVRFPKYDTKVASALGLSVTPGDLKGMTWVNYPYIKKANKSGYRYINIYYAASDAKLEFKTKWLWDGKEATPQQVAEIERYLTPSKGGEVRAAMYQIDPVNTWDGIFYMGESKDDAKVIFENIGK